MTLIFKLTKLLILAVFLGALLFGGAALFFGRPLVEGTAMYFAEGIANVSARGRIHASPAATPAGTVIIVPGCSPRSSAFRHRVEVAAQLYQAGKGKKLLLSGDGRHPSYDEPAAMRRALRMLGVPDAAMVEDKQGFSTLETLERARDVHGITSATFVTQQVHASRAALTAGGLGMDVQICCAQSTGDTAQAEAREARARVRVLLDLCGLRSWTAQWDRERRVAVGSLELSRW